MKPLTNKIVLLEEKAKKQHLLMEKFKTENSELIIDTQRIAEEICKCLFN
jgi:hypothetical protein